MHATPSKDPEDRVTVLPRRDFFGLLARGLLWLAGGLGLAGLFRFLSYGEKQASETRFILQPPSAYPLGSMTVIKEAKAFLFHDSGGFFARSAVCPHLGCVVEQEEGGFRCPCHGSRFDSNGELENGPSTRPLKGLWIELDSEGNLVLDASREVPPEWRLAS